NFFHGGAGDEAEVVKQGDELRNGDSGTLVEAFNKAGLTGRVEQGKTVTSGVMLQPFDGATADAPRGGINDASEGNVIARVIQEVEVGDNIVDFFALVELEGGDHLIRNAIVAKCEFQCA